MKVKAEVKEGEAGHTPRKEQKERLHGRLEGNSIITPQDVEQFIENLERKSSKSYWDDRTFEELLEDAHFQKMLDRICLSVTGRSRPVPGYGAEDLKQDVLINLGNWRPQFPGEKPSQRLLRAIARNKLIDMQRKSGAKSCSFESLYEEIDSEERIREIPCSEDHEAATYRKIRLEELISKLDSHEERVLLSLYLDSDKDASEIAAELGISRQAVSKRLKRIYEKLKPYV